MQLVCLFVLTVFTVSPTAQANDPGLPVVVQVVDSEGEPIRTAVIRNPLETDRHQVNRINGEWEATTLYLDGGAEIPFKRGMEVDFEVSAPGFQSTSVSMALKKRKNVYTVTLQQMKVTDGDDEVGDIPVAFGRDIPRD